VIGHAHAAARAAAAATSQLAQPGAIGHVAAGMLASVPGLLLIAMIAGGHWGGEWGSKTIRRLLCREGRRGRVLAAKWLSIWAAGAISLLACWLVLALLVAGITGIGRLSPASFVQAWMGFGPGGYLPTNFWSKFVNGGLPAGPLAWLAGVLLTTVAAVAIARWRFAADVTA
jgi:hypothetical protein